MQFLVPLKLIQNIFLRLSLLLCLPAERCPDADNGVCGDKWDNKLAENALERTNGFRSSKK